MPPPSPVSISHDPDNHCPVCFTQKSASVNFVRLACDHALCEQCASAASLNGHSSCPLCRQPHTLDPESLREANVAFRSSYAAWRSGATKGSTGEVTDVTSPISPRAKGGDQMIHVPSAGDLAVLNLNAEAADELGGKLGFAIVGMGRAGKIHLNVLQKRTDVQVRWLVDVCPEACPKAAGAQVTHDLALAIADPMVKCVIVSTPTPDHDAVIRAALEAGKHVFAEKPLCCDATKVPAIFDAAASRGLLLHTAYNRRHDPAICSARDKMRARTYGPALGATLVSRDYPYPTAAYLSTSGNLFKDCVVHDLDYLTWLLDDDVASLRATASTSDTARACGMWEFSSVHLTLASGATATLVNARVAPSYDHRLDIYCQDGTVRVTNPDDDALGVAFSDRFAQSYHDQLAAFAGEVRAILTKGAEPQPNVSLARTQRLAQLVEACEHSVAQGGADIDVRAGTATPPKLRTYDDTTTQRVRELYSQMRRSQCVEHVEAMRAKYVGPGQLGTVRMSVWAALELLASFVDVSDPDVTLPNHIHAFQTAEGLRAKGMPDWLQLTGLLHDLGKMIHRRGCDADGTSMATQWSVVGDTWVVGCAMPDALVFPELNAQSPDAQHAERRSELGIYAEGVGLDNVLCAFGHDEYLYQVLKQNKGVSLPPEALYVIRYHSLYPWHDAGCYQRLESAFDRSMKGWVKLFNQHDLYTKRDVLYSAAELAELRKYYTSLTDKYLPAELDW